jgi:acyl-CoA thioesterase YciA
MDERKTELINTHICMTKDIGVHGNLFGGYLLCWLDESGAIMARNCAGGDVVTLKISEVLFKVPIKVGDQIAIYGSILKVGKTSITVYLEVRNTNTKALLCTTEMVFIHIDKEGNKKEIIPKNNSG